MPLLLYCIAKTAAMSGNLPSGVSGTPVSRIEAGALTAIVSRQPDSAGWLQSPVKTSALEFHRVVAEVFKFVAVVPFRFPTIFATDEQLTKHLGERSDEYHSLLNVFAYSAQMEVRILYSDDRVSAGSGAEYLRGRQKALHAAEALDRELKQALSQFSNNWRTRAGKNGVRSFALVERDRVAEFEGKMRSISVPEGLNVRVSGPWPVSEFIEEG